MKINDFDDCLNYVNRLGFAGNGNIAYRQERLCFICDFLRNASGQASWYKLQPFTVCFSNHKSNGFCYPWLGSFTVNGKRFSIPKMN
jgi:hypothetical protein